MSAHQERIDAIVHEEIERRKLASWFVEETKKRSFAPDVLSLNLSGREAFLDLKVSGRELLLLTTPSGQN